MSLHTEIRFETEICGHLAGHGWTFADKPAAEYRGNLALLSAAVTGKIDVRGFSHEDAA